MNTTTERTALVTGATSGLGFDAAAQLAEAGYGRVIITGRTGDGAASAKAKLLDRTGKSVFETLVLDLADPSSVGGAAAELTQRGDKIDFLLLNAGMVAGSELVKTDEGIEITFASSLIGHHRLTMDILDRELLGANARIVIAGSEAARGDVPTFNPVDLPDFAGKHFDGDLEAAAVSLIRHDDAVKYKPATAYATAKLFVALWAASLARKLPEGTTVNAVSPGAAPDTGAARHANFFMKRVMMPVMKRMPKFMGMAAPISVAAARYLEASTYGGDVTGEFFASAPKKMTGPLHRVDLAHVADRASQDAAWNATVQVSGVDVSSLV